MTSLQAVTSPNWPYGEGANSDAAGPVLILLHGYGSNEHDLAGLAPMLPTGMPWASVRAPVDMGYGAAGWFPLNPEGVLPAAAVDSATQSLWEWIDANLPGGAPLVPLGFSQGGCMALQMLRTRPERVQATVVLAGFTASTPQAADEALKAARPAVFYGHGDADPVVPLVLVTALSTWLDDHVDAEHRVYPGLGHNINEQMMSDVNAFLGSHADYSHRPN